ALPPPSALPASSLCESYGPDYPGRFPPMWAASLPERWKGVPSQKLARSRDLILSIHPLAISPGMALFAPHIVEAGKFLEEGELQLAGRSIALFADDQVRDSAILVGRGVNLFAIDEANHVGVLFYGAAFPQIAQLRLVIAAASLRRP